MTRYYVHFDVDNFDFDILTFYILYVCSTLHRYILTQHVEGDNVGLLAADGVLRGARVVALVVTKNPADLELLPVVEKEEGAAVAVR
jgi:hypothetical protein